ncbi:methyltransferase domain-containing protein [Halomonas campisalis]|uniref:Methyltransferase domain-containing protein n=1 Tax=Billgrantia campisalis TaxID=74661 RepID=A0ABS9P367_9GAMM|nr:sulfotransferase [Halomonas campisalis]MCG6656233.1 methyltransferase domain-containing protein [Halomonas campisalis]MDR5861420.1 sulfotransferase [Halomonas campisalis]
MARKKKTQRGRGQATVRKPAGLQQQAETPAKAVKEEDLLADDRQRQVQALLAQQPETAQERRRVGLALMRLKAYRHALPHLEAAAAEMPESVELLGSIAQAHLYGNDYPQALTLLERALDRAPERFDLLYLKATALLASRRVEDAIALFRRCSEVAPATAKSLKALSRYVPLSQAHWDLLETIAQNPEAETEERADALFALGGRRLGEGKLQEAFVYFHEGNRCYWPIAPTNALPWEKLLRHIVATYPAGLFQRFAEAQSDLMPEVFIVGPSRSGKSLVESLLAEHPEIDKGGERFDFMDQVREAAGAYETLNGFIEALTPEDMPELRHGYLGRIGHRGGMVTNTHPDAIFMLGILGLMFPKTPIIFCMRGLLDLGMAAYFTKYDTGNKHSYDLRTLGEYIATYEKAMQHWANVLPNPIVLVEYSDLVKDPDHVAGNIYHSLGLGEYRPDAQAREQASRLLGQLDPASSVEAPTQLHPRFDGLAEQLIGELTPMIEGYQAVAEAGSLEEVARQQRLVELYQALIDRQKEANAQGMIGVIRRLLELEPDQPELKALLGTYVSQTGKHHQGVALLTQACEKKGQDRNIQIQLIEALLRARRWQEAEARLQAFPEADPAGCQLRLQAFIERQHAELEHYRLAQPSLEALAEAKNRLKVLEQASASQSPVVASLAASLAALEGDSNAIAQHQQALALQAAQESDGTVDGRLQMQQARLRLQFAASLIQLGQVQEGLAMLREVSRIRPYSLETELAYRRFTTWLADSDDETHQRWAGLHGLLSRQWKSYSQDDLQFSFGDFNLPYQGYDRVALPGSRPTELRLDAYGLREHLAELKQKKDTISALDIGCNHGFLLLELADQLGHGMGFDISPTCIEVGNTVASHLGIDNVKLAAMTFEAFIAGQPQASDLVIACAVHRWIGLPMPEFGRHLHSLVSDGGLLLLESQGIRRTNMTEQDFDAKVKQIGAAGFEEVATGALCDDDINYREFRILKKR